MQDIASPGLGKTRLRTALMTRTATAFAVAALIPTAIPATVAAQQLADATQQTAQSGSVELTEIIVTATKREENLLTVAVPVTVVNADKMANENLVALKDYYMKVPSLSILPNFLGNTNVVIRGVSTGTFGNPTVAVMVDGVPYTGSTGRQGNEIPEFDPADLARIEVLRGPQGTLFGGNSMGGLINYVTARPNPGRLTARVQAGVETVSSGSDPGYVVRASLNAPLGSKTAFRISGFGRRDAGYIDNVTSRIEDINKVNAYGAHVGLSAELLDSLSVDLTALLQRSDEKGSAEVVRKPALADLEQDYIPGTGWLKRWHDFYSGTVTWDPGIVKLTSVTGFSINEFRNIYDSSSFQSASAQQFFGVTGASNETNNFGQKVSEELRLESHFGSAIDVLLGGFYTREFVTTKIGSGYANDPVSGRRVGTRTTSFTKPWFKETSGFFNLTWRITDQIDIQGGLRRARIEQTSGYQWIGGPQNGLAGNDVRYVAGNDDKANATTFLVTPRLKLDADTMVYARFATGYRPGTPNSLLCTERNFICSSKPDKTSNYEAGLKGKYLDGRLIVDASIYYIDWKDILLQLTSPAPFFNTFEQNGAKAKNKGVELSVTVAPTDGLTLSAWVALNDAKLSQNFPGNSPVAGFKGDQLPNSPRWSYNLSADQEFAVTPTVTSFFGADFSYVGKRFNIFRPANIARDVMPAYTKVDFRAGVRWEDWQANFYVSNVTNSRGVLDGPIANNLLQFSYLLIRPRTIGLNLVKNF